MRGEIQEHLRQFDDAVSEAEGLMNGLDEAALNWSPSPEKWSVAQCLDHLTITARRYAEAIEPVVAAAPKDSPDKPAKRGWLASWFIRSLEPPVRFRAKAPQPFRPQTTVSRDALIRDYGETHRRLREQIEASNGVDLSGVKVVSPVAGWIKLRLGDCYAVICAHERRHLWQASEVRSAEGFPAAQT